MCFIEMKKGKVDLTDFVLWALIVLGVMLLVASFFKGG